MHYGQKNSKSNEPPQQSVVDYRRYCGSCGSMRGRGGRGEIVFPRRADTPASRTDICVQHVHSRRGDRDYGQRAYANSNRTDSNIDYHACCQSIHANQ